MFQGKASILAKFIGLTLGVALSVFAVSFVTYADWSQPPSTPPTCPSGSPGCDAPIHVGSGEQIKSGPLGIISVFRTNSASYFAVNSGNVGIGTDSPGAKLQVNHDTTAFNLETSGSPYLRFDMGGSGTSGTYRMYTWGSSRTLSLESMGDVAVVIDYNNNQTNKAFRVLHNGEGVSGNELFRVQENGNVGIGTDNPQSRLDVRRDARFYDSTGNLVLIID